MKTSMKTSSLIPVMTRNVGVEYDTTIAFLPRGLDGNRLTSVLFIGFRDLSVAHFYWSNIILKTIEDVIGRYLVHGYGKCKLDRLCLDYKWGLVRIHWLRILIYIEV